MHSTHREKMKTASNAKTMLGSSCWKHRFHTLSLFSCLYLISLALTWKRLSFLNANNFQADGEKEKAEALFTSWLYLRKVYNLSALMDSPRNCSTKYGALLIKEWKNNKKRLCGPYGDDSLSATTTTTIIVDCYHHVDESTETLCDVRNLAFNLTQLENTNSLRELNENENSVMTGSCKLTSENGSTPLAEHEFGEGAQRQLQKSFRTLPPDKPLQCDLWYNKTVMVVDRWDVINLFHAHEDFIQTFSAFLVADLDPKDTYLVLSDELETGPFGLFWDHIMTDMNGKALSLEDTKLRNPLASTKNLKQFLFSLLPPFPVSNTIDGDHIQSHTNICLKRVIFGVHAGISPLSREIGKSSSCGPPTTTLFLNFKDFVLERLGFPIDDVVNNDRKRMRKKIVVTFISRAGFIREISNEESLLEGLQDCLCMNRTAYDECDVVVQRRAFQSISFYEQIFVARETDVLIGTHGAALTSTIYLTKGSILMELEHPARVQNFHFSNIASFMGIEYHLFSGDDTLSTNQMESIFEGVKSAVIDIRARRKNK